MIPIHFRQRTGRMRTTQRATSLCLLLFGCTGSSMLNLIMLPTPSHSWTIGTGASVGSFHPTQDACRDRSRHPVLWSHESDDHEIIEYDDSEARSQFGTKDYWDELYQGMGDFPMDEYEWYFGFDKYWKLVQTHVPSKTARILVPGIGNDPVLLELLQKGYTKLTATDYSDHAIERQQDLLSYQNHEFSLDLELDRAEKEEDGNDDGNGNDDASPTPVVVRLQTMDARNMPAEWTDCFDAILEKGALDAIYLSGDGNVERTVQEFERVLKPDGKLLSVSGVVPPDLRREIFEDWNWIRDGSDDIEAGCFVLGNSKNNNNT